MGTEGESVVDPQFRLRNASGIWIVDGSIFPGITVGNPNATIMGLAWIAVEEIAANAGAKVLNSPWDFGLFVCYSTIEEDVHKDLTQSRQRDYDFGELPDANPSIGCWGERI